VGTPTTIAAAEKMDAVFWRSTTLMDEATAFDEGIWADIVRELESARLAFINVARREIIGVSAGLDRLPIARPPVPNNRPDS
jgi:hypothetical protein